MQTFAEATWENSCGNGTPSQAEPALKGRLLSEAAYTHVRRMDEGKQAGEFGGGRLILVRRRTEFPKFYCT